MPLFIWIHSATWLLLSSCYSRRQQLLIPPQLLLQPVIDKNMALSSGELNTAQLCCNTTMEGATMCYWGGGGGRRACHTLANSFNDRDKQSLGQLLPYAEHPERN